MPRAWVPGLLVVVLSLGVADAGAVSAARPAEAAIEPASQDVGQALARLNEVRRIAGLRPVTLDPSLSSACEKHARYLVMNIGSPEVRGLKAHQEVPTLPGYTPEGAAAGKASDISYEPLSRSVDRWVDTLYHRNPIMSPGLRTVGMGAMKGPRVMAALLMFGDRDPAGEEAYPVRYPADGQREVPHAYNRFEIPDPVPGGAKHAGYPITLHFRPGASVTGVAATLVDDDGHAVPIHLSSPERPALSFPQGATVCVIPQRMLKLASRYRVSVTASVAGRAPETWSWSFATTVPGVVFVTDRAAMNAAVDRTAYFFGQVERASVNGGKANFRWKTPQGLTADTWLTPAVWATLCAQGYGGQGGLNGKWLRLSGTAREIVPGTLVIETDQTSEVSVLRR